MTTIERLLGLRVDLSAFYEFARPQEKLGALVDRFRGLKPPQMPSIFEALINGIACQQITLTQGIRLLSRLASRYGSAFTWDASTTYAFPEPTELMRASPAGLRQLGLTNQKSRAIVELAASVSEGRIDLDALRQLPDEEAVKRLRSLHGVGRWTAEYTLLRGLGRTHVFPGDDVGARNNLQRWLEIAEPLDYKEIQSVLAAWHQYGGLIYFHLLLDRLEAGGLFSSHSAG
jgi:DNA-3-methyladenine glycosylase II